MVFSKGIIVAQFAKESFIMRKLGIVELFWTTEPFMWKKTLRLLSHLGFQELFKNRSSYGKVYCI